MKPPHRSYLFAPGNNARLVGKVFTADADAVVLDLEDAVPVSEKEAARRIVADAVRGRPGRPDAFVRINALDSGEWRADVSAVVRSGANIAGLRVPKAERLDDLVRLHHALSATEESAGFTPGSTPLVATIESARGLESLSELSRAPRLLGFAFGATDYTADVGAESGSFDAAGGARERLVTVSRAFGLEAPIASVFTRLGEDAEDALRADTERHRALGFFGRSAIHPRHVKMINAVFTPKPAEAEAARATVLAAEASEREGRAALESGGAFIDPAVLRHARRVIALFEAHGAPEARESHGVTERTS